MSDRFLLILRRLCLLGTVLAMAAGLAALGWLALAPPPVPPKQAWFCRIWTSAPPVASPMCARYPATYRPPWPYLGENGKVVDPSPAPQESP